MIIEIRKQVYAKVALKDKGVLSLFTDGQTTNENFLVFMFDGVSPSSLRSSKICWTHFCW